MTQRHADVRSKATAAGGRLVGTIVYMIVFAVFFSGASALVRALFGG